MTDYGDSFNAAIAAELRAERARHGVSYAEIIAATGLAQSTLQRYLKGSREIPLSAFQDICRAIGVSPRLLFERAEDSINEH